MGKEGLLEEAVAEGPKGKGDIRKIAGPHEYCLCNFGMMLAYGC